MRECSEVRAEVKIADIRSCQISPMCKSDCENYPEFKLKLGGFEGFEMARKTDGIYVLSEPAALVRQNF